MKHFFSTFLLFTLLFHPSALAGAIRYVEFTGKLKTETPCGDASVQVFVADAKSHTLLFQVETIANGSFFFRLKPADYEFRLAAASGCEALAYLSLKENTQKQQYDFILKPKKEVKK